MCERHRRKDSLQSVLFRHALCQSVMTASTFFDNSSPPCATESFDGIVLAFLHLCFIAISTEMLHNRHRLAAMNGVRCDAMAVEVADSLD